MLDLAVIIFAAVIIPLLINKSTESHFDWIKPHIREAWTVTVVIFTIYYLAQRTPMGVVMNLHERWKALPWLGYIAFGLFGAVIFCGYWWFTGKAFTTPPPPIPEALTKPQPLEQPARAGGLSMKIGGFITTGVEHDSTRVQVSIIASNDGEPTTARDWNMKITTSNTTILSHHVFGERLAKGSLEIPRLDAVLEHPLATTSEAPGYVSFIVPNVAQPVIDNLYKDPKAKIIVSVRDSSNREVCAERRLFELWLERHVRYPSK
jgi:hypothetical protein